MNAKVPLGLIIVTVLMVSASALAQSSSWYYRFGSHWSSMDSSSKQAYIAGAVDGIVTTLQQPNEVEQEVAACVNRLAGRFPTLSQLVTITDAYALRYPNTTREREYNLAYLVALAARDWCRTSAN